MKYFLFLASFVLAAFMAVAQAMCQNPAQQAGRVELQSRNEPPGWGTVRISELMPLPNLSVGLAGGEYVELYNAANSILPPADLSGWRIQTDSGASYIFPDGTLLPGEQYLVADFSNGTVASLLLPDYQCVVLVASGFQNTFFHNPGAANPPYDNGFSDGLALRDKRGKIRDFLLYSAGLPLPDGQLVQEAICVKQWEAGMFVPTGGLNPNVSDIGFCLQSGSIAAGTSWMEWLYGLRWVGPTPGTDHNWMNQWDPQTQTWSRSYAEEQLIGRVTHSPTDANPDGFPLPGARVTANPFMWGPVSVTTDSYGFYTVLIPPGPCQVHVEAPGFLDTWRVIEEKNPHSSFHLDVSLVPKDSTTSVSATISPEGTVVEGPMVDTPAGTRPLFKVAFPAGAVSGPTQADFSFAEGGRNPAAFGSMVLEAPEGWRTCWESLGALSVDPHLSFSGGPFPTVKVLYRNPFPAAFPGEALLVESISDTGTVERLPDGELVEEQGVLWAVAQVPHFSFVEPWKILRTADGKVIMVQDRGRTLDRTGDGFVDFMDSIPASASLCPGDSATIILSQEAEVATTHGNGWQASGSLSGQTGAILGLFAKGKVTVGGFYGESSSSSSSNTRTAGFQYTLTYNLPPPPPGEEWDEDDASIWVKWQIFWIKASYCTQGNNIHIHAGSESTRNRNDLPDEIVAVPVGFGRTDTPAGHCASGG